MSSADLYLSFDGRIDRARWFGGVLGLWLVVAFGWTASFLLVRAGALSPGTAAGLTACLFTVIAVPWTALDWKRFQDAGQPGLFALACPASVTLGLLWDGFGARIGLRLHDVGGVLLLGLKLAVAVWFVSALAGRAGTPGPNAYGPAPQDAP